MSSLATQSTGVALHQLQVRVGDDEPLRAFVLEVDLHARVRAAAFAVEHDALAELAVAHALAEPDAADLRRALGTPVDRARDDHRGPDFLDQLGRDLAQE